MNLALPYLFCSTNVVSTITASHRMEDSNVLVIVFSKAEAANIINTHTIGTSSDYVVATLGSQSARIRSPLTVEFEWL